MFAPQLLNSGFNNSFANGAQKANGFPRFNPVLQDDFSSNDKYLGGVSEGADKAGKTLLARLVTSVESRFSATNIRQVGPAEAAPAAESDFSPDAVTDRILGFVKARLDKEKANGASDERLQDLFEQAKSGIEKGFAEAREIIGDQGLFNDEVKDNYLETVSKTQKGLDQLESDLFGGVEAGRSSSPVPSSRTEVASSEFYYNQQRSFDMQVKTQDGDVVTIKVNGEESLSSSSFSASNDNVAVSGFESSYSNSSRFSFSVEGDLDEGELAALNDLFSQVNDIADDFYAGDVEEAFNQALDVGYDASELAGFAVNMRRTEVVAVRQTYAEVAQYGEPVGAKPENPFQNMMDKLTDFSAKVQQAHDSLLQGAKALDSDDKLLSQLLKELVPEQEELEKDSLDKGLPPNKAAFDEFVEAMLG